MASAKDKKDDKPGAEKADKKVGGGEKRPKGPQAGAGRKGKDDKARAQEAVTVTSSAEIIAARLRDKYTKETVPALRKQFNYTNPMQVPRMRKIVVNMGLGAAVANPKIIDSAVDELRAITGQKPVVTRSKKAIATYKLREGIPIGVMVTLRASRMWEFFDRLVSLALPRQRDFRGVSRKAFDGAGNYTLGLKEQIIFPEIDYDRIDVIKGMNVTIVTSAKTDEEARALLQHLGMPYRAN